MLAIAILAAGKGTRMKSSLPKVLQELSGITIIERVLNSCNSLKPNKTFIIVGHESMKIKEKLRHSQNLTFVNQIPQNGTGHAIQQLLPILENFQGELLVLNGDVPLLKENTIGNLIKKHRSSKADVSILSARILNPKGYGRVFSDNNGNVDKIIEDSDCTENELKNNLTNAGIYCFNWRKLKEVLPNLSDTNKQKEIYLTDAIQLLELSVHYETDDPEEVMGINDKWQLSICEEIHQKRLRVHWMKKGVKFINPPSSTISDKCIFGKDIVIEPNTHLRGEVLIGNNSHIGPNTLIENSSIGNNVFVIYSIVKNSIIGNNVEIGPYAHIRPESNIKNNCKIGNFVEVKKTKLDENSKVNHLSYLGDSEIGKNVNIGAGTITANYDGYKKHITSIGNNSNTGANSVLVAPINIGTNVTIGAGSTITKNVPNGSLGISRAKQLTKPNWSSKHNPNQ